MPPSSPRKKANRQNALKSTGPRSAAGKAVSSANATQHGILSRHLILPGESRAEFDALLQQLMGVNWGQTPISGSQDVDAGAESTQRRGQWNPACASGDPCHEVVRLRGAVHNAQCVYA
jgi:hypothetical protein